jgi:hypothetical protein
MPKLTKQSKAKHEPKRRFSSNGGAWVALEHALAQTLRDLGKEEFLIISHKTSQAFVQFAGHGRDGMRTEAISNEYLFDGAKLSGPAVQALLDAGWKAPTHSAATEDSVQPDLGSPNFFMDFKHPVRFDVLARIAVKSLRDVYKVRHPRDLQYDAFDDHGVAIRFPSLGLGRKPAERTPIAAATLDLTGGEWKVVLDEGDPGAFVCDLNDDPVAYVGGDSPEETLGRALLVASAPALREATESALRLLRIYAETDPGAEGAAAEALIPVLERALGNASPHVGAGTSIH